MTSSDRSKTITYNSLDRIYKPASTLKDSLENRLKREGFVEASTLKDSLENRLKREGFVDGIVENNRIYYKITSKGKTDFRNAWRNRIYS